MVVVEYALKTVKELTGLPEEKIIDGLTEIGAPTTEENGKIICELTPNRPDWFSIEGISRSLNAYYSGKLKEYRITKKSGYRLVAEHVSFRPCIAWAVVRGLKFDDQKIKDIVQLQDKLNVTLGRKVKKFGIGFYPFHNIEFPIKYVLMTPEKIVYRPLNYPREANATEILQNHPKGKEHGHLLSGQKKYPVYVDARGRIMCLIPIVNSFETGKVDENTTDVLVEVTGIEQNAVNAALNIICCSLIDAGGAVESVEIDYSGKKISTPDFKEQKIKLDLEFISMTLGQLFTAQEIKKLLKKMGYRCDSKFVYVPPYRADIMHQVDIVEDIAIAYGYNNFEPALPNFFSSGKLKRTQYDKVDGIMRGMGFLEAKSFILTNRIKLADSFSEEKQMVEIANPATEDYTLVRTSILVSMMEILAINKTRSLPQKIYEIGLVNSNGKTKTQFGMVMVDKKLVFADVRGYIQTLMKELGLALRIEKAEYPFLDGKTSCDVFGNDRKIGYFGELNKPIKDRFRLEFTSFVCVLEF